jgi:hypothetical protein
MTQPPGPYQPGQPANPWETPQPGYPAPESAPTGPFPTSPPAYPGAPQPYPDQSTGAYPTTGGYPAYGAPYPDPNPAPHSGAPAPYPGSGPPAPYPGSGPPAPYSGVPAPYSAAPYPVSAAPGGYPPYFGPPPRKSRAALITVIVLVLVVVLGGGALGAAYFLTRNPDGPGGKGTASAAVEAFLQAVYVDQDATKAAPLVCAAARDSKKLTTKIDEIKAQNKQYDGPKYTWVAPKTEQSAKDRAVLSTTVTLATDDVQRATQNLTFTTIKSTGWFVCDVQQS